MSIVILKEIGPKNIVYSMAFPETVAVNRNGRTYPRKILEKAIEEFKTKEIIKKAVEIIGG